VLLEVPQDWMLLAGGLAATGVLVLGRREGKVRESAAS
jgi:hypothetical protein